MLIYITALSKFLTLPRQSKWVWALFITMCFGVACAAQDPAPAKDSRDDPTVDGLFISVRNPIDTTAVRLLKAQTERFLDRPDRRGLKLVFDFNSHNSASRTDDFGVCHDLAEYLLSLQDVATIAFVRHDVTGHSVLPVLACKEVVMSRKARIGNVLGQSTETLAPAKAFFYRDLAERRRYFPAIVLKMADPQMEVVEGHRGGGTWYVDARRLDEEVKNGFIPLVRRDPMLAAGKAALYDATQARKFGLCQVELETRAEVKEMYQMPPTSLREDPLQGRTPNAWKINVSGKLDGAMKEKLTRRIEITVGKGANLIFLELECGDGDVAIAHDIASYLTKLRDDPGENRVMTVALVTKEARNTAVFLAMGCDEIVIDQKAQLGGFQEYLSGTPDRADDISKSLRALAELQGYSPLLARGMLEPNLTIHHVSRRGKAFDRRLMTEDQLSEDLAGGGQWVPEGHVKPFGVWLNLDSADAKKFGVAKHIFSGDPQQRNAFLRDKYGLSEGQPVEVKADWLEQFAELLCSPVVAVFLIMIGITGLILELKVPGVGVPGVIAAICFVLYFWAHSQLQGHLTMLAILLFLLGLILIGLEIFLVPGLGVPGISGIILVVVSLALATVVKKPETQHDWIQFGTTLTTISLSLLGAVAGAMAIGYYLPHIPWANRLVLVPPAESSAVMEEPFGASTTLAALLGAIGEAATALRPAGKARFNEDFIDVVAEGYYVEAGSRVQVIEIEGNRVVVKEV